MLASEELAKSLGDDSVFDSPFWINASVSFEEANIRLHIQTRCGLASALSKVTALSCPERMTMIDSRIKRALKRWCQTPAGTGNGLPDRPLVQFGFFASQIGEQLTDLLNGQRLTIGRWAPRVIDKYLWLKGADKEVQMQKNLCQDLASKELQVLIRGAEAWAAGWVSGELRCR